MWRVSQYLIFFLVSSGGGGWVGWLWGLGLQLESRCCTEWLVLQSALWFSSSSSLLGMETWGCTLDLQNENLCFEKTPVDSHAHWGLRSTDAELGSTAALLLISKVWNPLQEKHTSGEHGFIWARPTLLEGFALSVRTSKLPPQEIGSMPDTRICQ